jgi:MSHA biogenesis protein MshI
MGLFFNAKQKEGWMVIGVTPNRVGFAYTGPGRQVLKWGVGNTAQDMAKLAKELNLGKYQCATLLHPGEYQLLLVDAPNVEREELKKSIRWRVKDMLDCHVDDATIDVLDIPVAKNAPTKNHSMYAVAARNNIIQKNIRQFESAGIPLTVIDIPETAQRNIARLFEQKDRGLALLSFDEDGGLLTITYQKELYMARRLEIPWTHLIESGNGDFQQTYERIVLEVQRSLDHFDRQYHYITVNQMLLAPLPQSTGLEEYLGKNLDLPVATLDLNQALKFQGQQLKKEMQWQLFHIIGATLREEDRVL